MAWNFLHPFMQYQMNAAPQNNLFGLSNMLQGYQQTMLPQSKKRTQVPVMQTPPQPSVMPQNPVPQPRATYNMGGDITGGLTIDQLRPRGF